ncbi:MAG: hypothetical protein A3G49_05305 [Candidatus Sungbacteria bacterium RIFCSPLOWO2_12_FULL_41_11]|uniref:Uncharacterized protein n=1 Tax=Candidatus Sungbacteria bacterium RIFCSPLOWO2_12_FULL_41_11 TaxID=1802286 RepID=A0A1G2LUV0_9BACT|nr:MAG: hypothetical protein A3G49_05305 [Candidatus Sungbacteria bacterium RIFCSPLOWO2_12_FULL_41_11]
MTAHQRCAVFYFHPQFTPAASLMTHNDQRITAYGRREFLQTKLKYPCYVLKRIAGIKKRTYD